MKTMIKLRQITVKLFLFASVLNLTLISSCTTSRDVYNPNPKQQQIVSQGNRPGSQDIRNAPPEWIYAISDGFMIGTGSGTDISEARENAINDLKSRIAKLLGQTVSVYEFTATANRISGRNQVESESVLLISQRFENEFSPVIVFRHSNVLDYYFQGYGNNHTYYIKYRISDAELEAIKKDYNARAEKFRNLLGSITQVGSINNVEELINRYDELNILLHSFSNLGQADSIRINNAINRILTTVDDLHIGILESRNNRVTFQLASLGKPFSTSADPVIEAPASIKVNSFQKTGDQWSFTYEPQAGLEMPESIQIRFDYPDFSVQRRITTDKPAIPVNKEIMVSNLSVNVKTLNRWSGNIIEIEVAMNIKSDFETMVDYIDMALISNTRHRHGIMNQPVNLRLLPGCNEYKAKLACDISNKFLRTAHQASIVLTYFKEGTRENKNFEVPVTIINF